MKRLLILPFLTFSLFALEGTSRVDEVLKQLTRQYEADQAVKGRLERDKFELDAKTTELNNQRTIKELLRLSAIIKVGDSYMAFVEADKEVFVRLGENQTYKGFKINQITSNGFFYQFKQDSGYLPLEISARVLEKNEK